MTAETVSEELAELERVVLWRLNAFQALGVDDYPQALELAISHADLHRAQVMVERGCAPELLAQILI